MKARFWVPLFLFLSLVIHELWTVINLLQLRKLVIIQPFPFSSEQITRERYIFDACGYLIFAILTGVIDYWATWGKFYFRVLFIFAVAEFFEYFLIYNEPWFMIEVRDFMPIAFHITNIRFVVMFVLLLKLYYQQWNLGNSYS